MALSLQRYIRTFSTNALNRILKERILEERQKSVIITAKFGDVLPETLIVEILSWLPVKDLLQFKSVCKSWYAIITSPYFISKHIQHYYNNNNDDYECLLVHYFVTQAELQLFELLLDETLTVLEKKVLYNMPMYGSYMYGPCDGLYYLYRYYDHMRALWNPAINEIKMLPPIFEKPNLPSKLFSVGNEVYGFGYDVSTKDYKVVVIQGWWTDRSDYFFVSGCFYWLGQIRLYEHHSNVIICFDLAAEECHEISAPNYEQEANTTLGMYHDTIAFLCVHNNHFDIWTMNDDRVWTKTFTIGLIPGLWNPVGHWMNNTFLLQYGPNLLLCDTETEEIIDLAFEGERMCSGVFVYKESLVTFKG